MTEKSFQNLNNYLKGKAMYNYFYQKNETILFCDASPFGIYSVFVVGRQRSKI